jgi:hypothetical protein
MKPTSGTLPESIALCATVQLAASLLQQTEQHDHGTRSRNNPSAPDDAGAHRSTPSLSFIFWYQFSVNFPVFPPPVTTLFVTHTHTHNTAFSHSPENPLWSPTRFASVGSGAPRARDAETGLL